MKVYSPSNRPRKIAIIGAGAIGTKLLSNLSDRNAADQIFVWNRSDTPEINKLTGNRLAYDQAHDILNESEPNGHEYIPLNSTNGKGRFHFSTDLQETLQDADIVIITAGIPRKDEETRADLLKKNCPIIDPIAEKAAKVAPNATYIIITNPVDTLTQRFYEECKKHNDSMSPNQIVGLSNTLDRARLRQSIRFQVGVSPEQIENDQVIGQHGDAMVPLLSQINIRQVDNSTRKLTDILEGTPDKLTEIRDATVKGGGRLVKLLKTSDHRAPAAALTVMIEQIINAKWGDVSQSKAFNCSAYLSDEGIYIGHPVQFGKDGRYTLGRLPELSPLERTQWHKSLQVCKEALADLPGRKVDRSVA